MTGGFCYYFSAATDRLNWRAANGKCNAIFVDATDYSSSSYLLSVRNQMEQDFILSQLGVRGNGANHWTGLHGSAKNSFYWTDNTPWDFNAWAWGEPNSQFQVSIS